MWCPHARSAVGQSCRYRDPAAEGRAAARPRGALRGLHTSAAGAVLPLRIQHKLASQTEAREAVNDFFVKLHLRWQEALRSDNLAAFAWKMLHDHIVDVLRRRDRRPTPVDTAFFPVTSVLWSVDSDPLDALLTRIDLYRALAQLPERQRTCFWLRHVLGYTAVEIADITGISASTIRTHLQHATRQLARALQPDDWSVPAPRKAS
ncbi:RNA polymerase sigma factor [Streptomyces nodosus]|uniref:RNA polymerase sigma factor n=1 Tax=Streptomyces nodosus TaxID=40318 RepID=UPI0037F54B73